MHEPKMRDLQTLQTIVRSNFRLLTGFSSFLDATQRPWLRAKIKSLHQQNVFGKPGRPKNWLTEVGLKNSSESTTIVIYRH